MHLRSESVLLLLFSFYSFHHPEKIMKPQVEKMVKISNLMLWLWVTATMTMQCSNGAAVAPRQVAALFVFGDSLVDVGNNNFLSSLAKANYYPYGIDFPAGPSGRFTNGETFVDMLGNFSSALLLIIIVIRTKWIRLYECWISPNDIYQALLGWFR